MESSLEVGGVALVGIVLGLAAAIAYAAFNILGELALAKVSPLVAMCFTQWVCAIALLVILKGDIMSIPVAQCPNLGNRSPAGNGCLYHTLLYDFGGN